jgi:hypothetical protein
MINVAVIGHRLSTLSGNSKAMDNKTVSIVVDIKEEYRKYFEIKISTTAVNDQQNFQF